MRCWRWWSRGTLWWLSWRSRDSGRRKKTKTWRLSCFPRVPASTGLSSSSRSTQHALHNHHEEYKDSDEFACLSWWHLHVFLMFTSHPGSAQGRPLHLSLFMLQWKSKPLCLNKTVFCFFGAQKKNKQEHIKDILKGTQLLSIVLFSNCYRRERSLDSISILFYFDYWLKVGRNYSWNAFPTHNAMRHVLPQSVSINEFGQNGLVTYLFGLLLFYKKRHAVNILCILKNNLHKSLYVLRLWSGNVLFYSPISHLISGLKDIEEQAYPALYIGLGL